MSLIRRGDGNTPQIVAPGNLTTGVPVLINSLFGVPVATVASGGDAAMELDGIQELPKDGTGGPTFAVGAKVYWNEGTKLATATATDPCVGECIVAAGASDAFVTTRIYGHSIEAVDPDAVAAAGLGTLASLTTTDKTSAVAAINEVVASVAADVAKMAKIKRGTVAVATGANNGTAAMGAATWDGKPVVVTLQSATGALAAALVQFKAVVAAGTLTVTLIDKDGAGVNAGSDLVFAYHVDAN